MLLAARQTISDSIADQPGRLVPALDQLKVSSRLIAIAVAKTAIEEGLAQVEIRGDVESIVDQHIWNPHYLTYQKLK